MSSATILSSSKSRHCLCAHRFGAITASVQYHWFYLLVRKWGAVHTKLEFSKLHILSAGWFSCTLRLSLQINEARVIAVGPGLRTKDGDLIPVTVKEGDSVLLPEYGGSQVKLGEKE